MKNGNKKLMFAAMIMGCVLLFGAGMAQANIITDIPAEANAMVRGGEEYEDNNYGDPDLLEYGGSYEWNKYNTYIYMRFDVSGIDKSLIENAELRMTAQGEDSNAGSWTMGAYGYEMSETDPVFVEGTGGDDGIDVNDSEADTSWLHYKEAPALTYGDGLKFHPEFESPFAHYDSVGVDKEDVVDGTVLTWDLTEYMENETGDGDYAVVGMDIASHGTMMYWYARSHDDVLNETVDGPTLRLNVIPEPSSLVMLGLAGLLLMKRRRI